MKVLMALMGVLMSILPFADTGVVQHPVQGTVVFVGIETVNVDVGTTVLRNVKVAQPLTVDNIHNRDIVVLAWISEVPYVTNVLGHETALRYDPLEDTEPPPAPINVRVVQGGFGVRLEWDWGGTNNEKGDLSYYEVDARLPGGAWGYDTYPVSEGTREVHYSNTGVSVQCRVRAVDFRGNESAWVASSELLADSVAPPAPDGFTVENITTGIKATWSGPTTEEVADLAGYYLYATQDESASGTGWTGTGTASRALTISANTLSVTYPMSVGVYGYFNLTAFDANNNESGFAVNPWVLGEQEFVSGQILTNSDFERCETGIDGSAVNWGLSEDDPPQLEVYPATTIGYDSSTGINFYVSANLPTAHGWLEWPGTYDIDVLGKEGGVYVFSAYVKLWPDLTWLEAGDTPESVIDLMYVGSHNGSLSSYGWCTTLDTGYVNLGNDWYRVWKTVEWHSAGSGYDYLAVRFYQSSDMHGGTTSFYIDRPMLQLGREPTAWTLNPTMIGSSGLSLDTAGIVSETLVVTKDGEFDSVLEPATDAAYDVGGTNRWKDGNFSGTVAAEALVATYISATGGATSTGDVSVGGDVVAVRDAQSYITSLPVMLQNRLTSTSFDGDSFSTTSKTLIDMESEFSLPAGIKGVILEVYVRDSASSGVSTFQGVILGPTNDANIGINCNCNGAVNDAYVRHHCTVPCDDNGDIYYQVVASGSSTLDLYIDVWGYLL